MKKYVLPCIGIIIVYFTAFVYAQPVNNEMLQLQKDFSLNGTWFLLPVLPSDTAAGKLPFLTFNLKMKKFNGNDGCNDISGTFVTAEDKLSFNNKIKGITIECKGYNEKAFLHNLLLTSNYKIEDSVLLLINGKTVLSKWTRQSFKNTGQKNIVYNHQWLPAQ